MSQGDHEFKSLTLKDIRFYRDKIQRFLDDTYANAENAVENLFSNRSDPDFLKNLDDMNTLLKNCREKLVVVASSIPDIVTEPSQQSRQPLEYNANNFSVPKMSVVYNTPYLVKLLLPASPSRFWLHLESTSTDRIEEELRTAYANTVCLKSLPSPGNFVVCLYSGKYCRGKVITTLEFSSAVNPQVDVILVDYGETIMTSIDWLYPIQSKFCTEPAHGMLCSLFDLEPLHDGWDVHTIAYFRSQCDNLAAIFHPPPDNQKHEPPFSKFYPDYYVSLLRRNCEEDESDIRVALVNRGMGRLSGQGSKPEQKNTSQTHSEDPQRTLNSSYFRPRDCLDSSNQPLESSTPTTDLSKSQPKGKNGHEVTVALTATSLVSNDLPTEMLSLQKLDLSKSKNSTSKIQDRQESQGRKFKSVLNTNAPEFKSLTSTVSSFMKTQSTQINDNLAPSNIFSQEVVQNTIPLGSDGTGLSSGATKRKPKIRAVPTNVTKNLSNTNSSSATATIATTFEDEVDTLLQPPNKAFYTKSVDSDYTSQCHEPIRKQTDPLLMEQFLDSVSYATPIHRQAIDNSDGDTPSYVTAASQFHHSDRDWEPSQKNVKKSSFLLEYQYGAILKSRQLPAFQDQAKKIQFCLAHVESPSDFYIHLHYEISSLVEPLCNSLNSLYRNSQEVPVTQPEVGSFWVIQESCNNLWSRAKVLSVATGKDKSSNTVIETREKVETPTCVTVFLVDWGSIDIVEVSKLRPLVKEILNTPCLAIRCRLDGIFPRQRSEDCKEWTAQATDKFIELTGFDKELTALVSSRLDKEDVLPLVVLQDGNEDKYSVNELLVHLYYASSHVFKLEKSPELDDQDWDPMSDDFYSSMNTVGFNTENYDSVTTGHIPQDEGKICRFFRASGNCYKGNKCLQLHSRGHKNDLTEDQIEVYIDIPALPPFVLGSLVSVQVTCVTNAYRFYAIVPHGPRDLKTAFCREDESETLESLQEALQKEYTTNYYLRRLTISPSLGDVVIAKSPEDDRWYRGRVVKEEKDELFGIHYLDYGNAQLVHLRDICNMIPRFVHFPAQAIEMFLNGVDTSEKADTEEARNTLVLLVQNRDLVARVIHDMPYICVDLYDTFGPYEVNIAAEMIRRQVAIPAEKKSFCQQSSKSHVHVIAG